MDASQEPHVVVVGGGISGLAAALRMQERAPTAKLTLLEASGRLGGVLVTERIDDFLVEHSADNFITDEPHALAFCRKIDFEQELIPTNPAGRRAFIVHRGRLLPIPDGFLLMAPSRVGPILRSSLLSPAAKIRLGYERFVARRKPFDPVVQPELEESLSQFATRRLGRETFERIVQPLVSGIYSADPEKLSVAATMPRFLDMERDHGSLTRAALAKQRNRSESKDVADSGARYSLFMAPRRGMSSLVDAAADKLANGVVRLNCGVEQVCQVNQRWRLNLSDGESIACDQLILATSADVTSHLLQPVDAELASDIGSIPLAGCSIVCLGYRRTALEKIPEGFGFVVPAVERRRILAASYSSEKFPQRAGNDEFLVRVFIGGACQPELADLPDAELTKIATEELGELIGLREAPIMTRIARWQHKMPQYHVGHLALVDRIERRTAALQGLAVTGNAYRGVGIPHCIKNGEAAADQILAATSSK